MTISIKPTASETTIQENGSNVLTINSSGITMASGKAVDVATALSTASGSAPSYSARAWCKLSADAIQASGNISSVTDNGTGNYTINFATAMPDADYAIGSSTTQGESNTSQAAANGISVRQYTTTSFRVLFYQGTSGGFYDPTTTSFIITR